jgi:hypothetical protein
VQRDSVVARWPELLIHFLIVSSVRRPKTYRCKLSSSTETKLDSKIALPVPHNNPEGSDKHMSRLAFKCDMSGRKRHVA